MTELSRFYSGAGYSQEQYAEVFQSVHINGVDAMDGNLCAVAATTVPSMNVTVDTGTAWINGYWYRNIDLNTLPIAASSPTYPRKDYIVLRNTVASGIVAAVITGTPSASPVPPTLTKNSTVWELPLAIVTVAANASVIYSTDIEDKRGGLCGASIAYTIDGGDGIISPSATTGKGYMEVPFACRVIGVTMLTQNAGSVVVDIRKSTYDAFPATTTICGATPPTITNGRKMTDTTLTGWTVYAEERDVLEYFVTSCTGVSRAQVFLHVVLV